MPRKLFSTLIIVIAIILPILGFNLPQEKASAVLGIISFFEMMLPILIAGALINYLWKNSCCNKD